VRVQQAVGYAQLRHSQLRRSAGLRQRYSVESSETVRALRASIVEATNAHSNAVNGPVSIPGSTTQPAGKVANTSTGFLRRVFQMFSSR
jgi:hypothetical protein